MKNLQDKGFTFIELMVVIFIIGLITTLITVEFRHREPAVDLYEDQLFSLLMSIQKQAVLRDTMYGLFFQEKSYEIKTWDEEKNSWKSIRGVLGGQKSIPASVTLTLDKGNTILFYPSGEISSFRLQCRVSSNPRAVVITQKEGRLIRE